MKLRGTGSPRRAVLFTAVAGTGALLATSLTACSSSAKTTNTATPTTAAPAAAAPAATPSTGGSCTSPAGAKGPGVGASTVGFIYVGSKTDYGYNQAAHDGATFLGKACPNLKVLEADQIPETSDMTRIAETMISNGAKII